ncbi:P-loop containing nucleoside triphosphate hydrolase protein [Amniculicola lignicola CBS 123094]|uniref:P-loop containing nucleoside triphosphate hydrolase protein n=1 Tax=Amniculicola lignicola CBS 123094 TaxID=1392246 RepID=A0A6A5WNG3_9PLEO|nr:P-loop containing nucleoside triphosphate hydrolase protein [Amniculicola lignicola CBS 123094]
MASMQVPMSPNQWRLFQIAFSLPKCDYIWDSKTAQFSPCFLPVVSAIPALVTALVLLTYSLRLFNVYRPQWTKPFITEPKQMPDELDPQTVAQPAAPFGLLIVSLVGLTLQISTVFFPSRDLMAVYPLAAWAMTVTILLVQRPKTAPTSILSILIAIFFAQLAVLSQTRKYPTAKDIPLIMVPVVALTGVLVILNMPLRDPSLPKEGISAPFTIPTTKLRTPEDSLTPWQYMTVSWMAPLIKKGVTTELDDEDVWDLGYEFKHERLHSTFRVLRGTVSRRLLRANGIDLVRTTSLALLQLTGTLMTPVVLQRLLASMQDQKSPEWKRATITYAFMSLILRLGSAQSGVFSLWYSRRAYERSRGEMITMLYEKTMNRKILGAKQEVKPEQINGHTNGDANGETNGTANRISGPTSVSNSPLHLFLRALAAVRSVFKKKEKAPEVEKGAASMGKILNLMRNDVYEISQRFWDFPDIISKPAGAIFATLLIWKMLGWACLLGVLALLATQSLNVLIARYQIYFEKKRRVATDLKLQRTSQFIESIRHLRWYGWQESWLHDILEARQTELNYRIIQIFFSTTLSFILRFGGGLFPAVAFYAFTTLAGKPLRIDLIFPALDLFNLLESYLRALPQLVTTLLNAYVAMGRIEDFMNEPDKEQDDTVPAESNQFRLCGASFAWPGVDKNVLEHITLSFPTGLTVIYGEVAAGKTALLQALLGEIDKTEGEFIRPDEVIGYCAQTPWLQSLSIRDNILFDYPYEEVRYKQVLEACALMPDMAEFKHGDLSNIGENGIGLSGGQKARVALARAVYSAAKVIFLDDPLSALDHQTAEFIVRKLLAGPLMKDRITVLVTHRTELCHGLANQWVELDKGKATIHEPNEDEVNALHKTATHESVDEEDEKKKEQEVNAAIPDKFIEDEHRATGGVKLRVYWRYIKSGTLLWWSISVFVMALFRLLDISQTWFMKAWGEGYDIGKPKGIFDFLPDPSENVIPWLQTFFVFVTATACLYWWTYLLMYGTGYHAAKVIFKEAIVRVAHATFRYYDVTPVGRLMNRLTSDMNTIDGSLSIVFTVFAWTIIGWISCVIIILGSTPAFLAFGLCLSAAFVYFFYRFLPTSQSLRRLEMVSLSPLMSNFGALVEGLSTVRAFQAQSRFQARVITVVDSFQKNDHFYWSLQSWLGYRFSTLSASSTLMMTLIAVYMGLSPGLTAFVLITASKFVIFTDQLCKIYGYLEMDFTSVERVVELLDLETEPPGVVDPPAWWPSYTGEIVFKNVTIRYAPNLDPALQNINLRIPAGSNTAVIGRTGSGKSTLALCLLATIVAEEGQILIDDVDISTVNKQALRSRVTFLAQEPVLFPGTMRKNLDPLSEFSDAACESVLSKIAPASYQWTLTTSIEGKGTGLSQGQRQLVGLARAMLRRSAVLIMDEATASIDFETSQRIQTVLREEMRESTVITIAHRLEAVRNADYCVVLSKGKVEKAGRAEDMLREGSELRGMLA